MCKENFSEVYFKYIKRQGADKLFEWLATTDFFQAPASTRFHGTMLVVYVSIVFMFGKNLLDCLMLTRK